MQTLLAVHLPKHTAPCLPFPPLCVTDPVRLSAYRSTATWAHCARPWTAACSTATCSCSASSSRRVEAAAKVEAEVESEVEAQVEAQVATAEGV